jgi:hypothetical protein
MEGSRGACSPGAVKAWAAGGFVCAEDGFYYWNGTSLEPIGAGRVNKHFTSILNYPYRGRITSALSADKSSVMFAVPTGSSLVPNYQFIYNFEDNRWTNDDQACQLLIELPRGGISADDSAAIIEAFGTDIADDLTGISVDSPAWRESRRDWAAVGTDRQVQTFTGSNRKAVISTGEVEPNPTMQSKVTELWPVINGRPGTITARVYGKNAMHEDEALVAVATTNQRGIAKPKRAKRRFLRYEFEIAAGAPWSEAVGTHADTTAAGGRSGAA